MQNAPAGCTETACLPLGFQGQTHRLKYTAGALARRTRSGAVGAPRYARLGSAGGAHGQCGGRARRDARRWAGRREHGHRPCHPQGIPSSERGGQPGGCVFWGFCFILRSEHASLVPGVSACSSSQLALPRLPLCLLLCVCALKSSGLSMTPFACARSSVLLSLHYLLLVLVALHRVGWESACHLRAGWLAPAPAGASHSSHGRAC